MEMNDMYLYGAGGHASVIIDILKANNIEVRAVIDDNPLLTSIDGLPVICPSLNISPLIISIGDNSIRKAIAEKYDVEYGKAIHPSAIIAETVNVGVGSVIMHGAIIQAHSNIGKHCIINTKASIDHHCVIEDYCHIAPSATICGNVHISSGTFIGAGAIIIQGIKIGRQAIIGAGAVVTTDVPDNSTVVGIPAKPIMK